MVRRENNISNLRSLSQIFTTSNLRRIVDQDYTFTDNRIKKSFKENRGIKRQEHFKKIYKALSDEYKGEYIFKNALLNKILIGKHSIKTTTAFSEFKIAGSIADFVLLNGSSTVYEIKTDLDTLQKLDKQISDYKKFAEKIYVVTTGKNSNKILEKYEGSNIGIMEYTSRNSLKEIQVAKIYTDSLCHETLFKTLRKAEYTEILEKEFGIIPQIPNTRIYRYCLNTIKNLNIHVFKNLVIQKLKERQIAEPELLLSKETPYEWKHLCYTLDLKKKEYENFYKYLSKKL